MAYFQWAEDMSIDGGGPIDQDHLLLIHQVNELHTATSQGRGREIVESLLQHIISSTEEHLRREEHLMEAAGFPHLREHQGGHLDFMRKLRELQVKQHQGSITVAAQLSSVLRDWLSLHIRRHDKELKRFSQQQARERARQQRSAQRHLVLPQA